MPRLDMVQPSAEMHAKVDELAVFLDKAGATVGEAMPDVDRSAYLKDYLTLLAVITSLGQSRSDREKMASETAGTNEDLMAAMAKGFTIDAMDYVMLLGRREAARAAWRAFFKDWDVLVCPAALDAAFKHQSDPQPERMLPLDDTEVRLRAQHRLPDVGDLHRPARDRIPRRTQLGWPAVGAAGNRAVSRRPHDDPLRATASSASGTASNLRPATDRRVRGGGASSPRRLRVSRHGTSRTT